jgi:hypothetical protein
MQANAALSAELARDLLVLIDGAHADTETKLAALAIAQSVLERRGLGENGEPGAAA